MRAATVTSLHLECVQPSSCLHPTTKAETDPRAPTPQQLMRIGTPLLHPARMVAGPLPLPPRPRSPLESPGVHGCCCEDQEKADENPDVEVREGEEAGARAARACIRHLLRPAASVLARQSLLLAGDLARSSLWKSPLTMSTTQI